MQRFLCKIGVHGPVATKQHRHVVTGGGVDTCKSCNKVRTFLLYYGEKVCVTRWEDPKPELPITNCRTCEEARRRDRR